MIRIAVCDDQPSALNTVDAYLTEYLQEKGMVADITSFSHPDELLKTIETQFFHLYLLDIVMPLFSGLEVGKEIRRRDLMAQIVYVTTEPQFALQAYGVNPLNYLIKPLLKGELFNTLDLAISKIDDSDEIPMTIKTPEGLRIMKPSEILCCEYKNHGVQFNLITGETVSSRTIRERFADYLKELLENPMFLQCHTSFVINMNHIQFFAKNGFTLYGGVFVPISSKQYALVRDRYMDYLMRQRGNV